jgi:hypothetical protein
VNSKSGVWVTKEKPEGRNTGILGIGTWGYEGRIPKRNSGVGRGNWESNLEVQRRNSEPEFWGWKGILGIGTWGYQGEIRNRNLRAGRGQFGTGILGNSG